MTKNTYEIIENVWNIYIFHLRNKGYCKVRNYELDFSPFRFGKDRSFVRCPLLPAVCDKCMSFALQMRYLGWKMYDRCIFKSSLRAAELRINAKPENALTVWYSQLRDNPDLFIRYLVQQIILSDERGDLDNSCQTNMDRRSCWVARFFILHYSFVKIKTQKKCWKKIIVVSLILWC